MLPSISQLITEIRFWLHLATLLLGPFKENLLCILHNKKNDPLYQGLPEDPAELYKELSTTHKKKLNKLVRDKVLNKNDLKVLLPTGGENKTYSNKFDVTLITVLIINCTTLQPPKNGWNQKSPPTNDPSVAAYILLGKYWRNFVIHELDPKSIDQALFDAKWDEGVAIVKGLGGDITEMETLKTTSLDPKQDMIINSLLEYGYIEVEKLRKRVGEFSNDLNTHARKTDGQVRQIDGQVRQIDGQVRQIDGQVQKIDGEVQQIQQRLDQQNEDIAADKESIHNKIDEKVQQTDGEVQQIGEKVQQIDEQAHQHDEEIKEIKIKMESYDQMINQLTDILSAMQKIKKQDNYISNNKIDIKEACCKDVLIYVAEEMDKDWKQFLMILTNDHSLIEQMQRNGKSGRDNMMDFFESIAFQLKWNDLKTTLHNMEKQSIVNHIEKNFLYTRALQLASDKLKQHYIEEMVEWVIDQPFNLNSSGGTNPMSREQGYVDLAVLTGEQVDNEWKNSDREAIMEMKHLQIQSIGIDDLWKPADQFVIVRGIAGIGKSTLIQRYVLKWSKDEILNGINNIDFLFFFECRELNTMPNIKSIEDLLKVKYPQLFDFIDLSDLQNIADRIMIIVDGLDELQGIYDKIQEENIPMTNVVKKMIDPKSSILKGQKTIVGGRHNACESIISKMKQTSIKIVEVCGFSENKSIEYIERFFGSDVQRANKVKEIIKLPNIRVMSNVPVLLWVICLLYSEDFDEEINTVTELYVYGLFAFLNNHIRGQESDGNIGLGSFVTSQHFGEIVYSLSILSVKTYMTNKVVFIDDDIGDLANGLHLERTGLIVKYAVGKFGHQAYQFKHLIFQEFLCALHLCLAKGVSKYNTNRELSSCTSTILGIHHLVETKNNQLFLAFYQNLKTIHKNSRTWMEYVKKPLNRITYNSFIQQQQRIIQKYFKKNKFKIKDNDFKLIELMRNFRENNWLINDKTAKKIRSSKISVKIAMNKNVEVLEFLQTVNVDRINHLRIFVEEFTESGLELIRMAHMAHDNDPTLCWVSVGFTERSYSSYDIYSNISLLTLSSEKKQIIPNYIKSSFNEFQIDPFYGYIYKTEEEEEIVDNVFFTMSDLIEHVLENHETKKMTIIKFETGFFSSGGELYHIPLIQRIRSVFGQREHFENIVIEE